MWQKSKALHMGMYAALVQKRSARFIQGRKTKFHSGQKNKDKSGQENKLYSGQDLSEELGACSVASVADGNIGKSNFSGQKEPPVSGGGRTRAAETKKPMLRSG